jgi:hypothetical protein
MSEELREWCRVFVSQTFAEYLWDQEKTKEKSDEVRQTRVGMGLRDSSVRGRVRAGAFSPDRA